MDDIQLQLLLALAMLIATIVAGFAPLKILKALNSRQNSKLATFILSMLSCFAGGIFLATCFIDLLPHVTLNYQKFKSVSGITTKYPVPELLICLGVLSVYILELICALLISNGNDNAIGKKKEESDPLASKMDSNNGISLRDEDATKSQFKKLSIAELSITKRTMSETNTFHSIAFTSVMSLHSILEGFALGVQDETVGIISLFISLMVHKGIESFSVGLQISKLGVGKTKTIVITIIIYSLMTPIGSVLGLLLQQAEIDQVSKGGSVFILEALAAGTFIYVTFFEVLAAEKENECSNLWQFVCVCIGFTVIALLQLLEQISYVT